MSDRRPAPAAAPRPAWSRWQPPPPRGGGRQRGVSCGRRPNAQARGPSPRICVVGEFRVPRRRAGLPGEGPRQIEPSSPPASRRPRPPRCWRGRVLARSGAPASVGGLATGGIAETPRGADRRVREDALDRGDDKAPAALTPEPIPAGRLRSVTHSVDGRVVARGPARRGAGSPCRRYRRRPGGRRRVVSALCPAVGFSRRR